MKKIGLFFTATAVLLLSFAALPNAQAASFAASSDEAAKYFEQQPQEPEVSEEELFLIQQAFSAGLQTLDAHNYTDSLTDLDKEILTLLEDTIPGIINKIQTSITDVEEELIIANETLARKVIANQNLYPAPSDWETATVFAFTTSIMHAMMNDKIKPEVAEILLQESMDSLMQGLPQEGY